MHIRHCPRVSFFGMGSQYLIQMSDTLIAPVVWYRAGSLFPAHVLRCGRYLPSHLSASHSKKLEVLLVLLTQDGGTNFKALTVFLF